MIYIGIDIAKEKHFAAAMTADGEVLIQPFGFNPFRLAHKNIIIGSRKELCEKAQQVTGGDS